MIYGSKTSRFAPAQSQDANTRGQQPRTAPSQNQLGKCQWQQEEGIIMRPVLVNRSQLGLGNKISTLDVEVDGMVLLHLLISCLETTFPEDTAYSDYYYFVKLHVQLLLCRLKIGCDKLWCYLSCKFDILYVIYGYTLGANHFVCVKWYAYI